MKKVISVSGGKSSAYIAANYESDELVFSLVRTSDKKLIFPDAINRKRISDRLGVEFIGTLEEDDIIYTMLDLEQYLGKKINWVTGLTFEDLINKKGGYLPNRQQRFCTTELKIRPIFEWWHSFFNAEPIEMLIGYRASEASRCGKMLSQYNKDGLIEFKHTFEKHASGLHKGRNKWVSIPWRKVSFPLVEDAIYKDDIEAFWDNKPVRFANMNNCVGCMNRNAKTLKYQSINQKDKFKWFIDQEEKNKGFWKKNISYKQITSMNFSKSLFDNNFGGCDSGFCGM